MKRLAGIVVLAVIGLFLLIQAIPYGRDHTNPPVIQEPVWDSPQTRVLAQRACFDCHSNETVWPWYSTVAPMSWLLQHDVIEGREVLNFSEWGRAQGREQEIDDAAETVREGSMPPRQYLPLHPEANLTVAEQEALIRGLQAIGAEGEKHGREDDD